MVRRAPVSWLCPQFDTGSIGLLDKRYPQRLSGIASGGMLGGGSLEKWMRECGDCGPEWFSHAAKRVLQHGMANRISLPNFERPNKLRRKCPLWMESGRNRGLDPAPQTLCLRPRKSYKLDSS